MLLQECRASPRIRTTQNLLDLPADLLSHLLGQSAGHFPSRQVCRAFRKHHDAGCTRLFLRWRRTPRGGDDVSVAAAAEGPTGAAQQE